MEIRIQSAGKELGPYTESEIRQYLSEGVISASDPALAEGMTEWLPTEQLLAQMPVAEAAPEPAPIPETTPEPSPEPCPETSSGMSPETGAEPIRSVSVRTSALPKVKKGPIVLQASLFESGESRRPSRTGKTAVTIEAPRPTTQLPPVAKFVPKEERKLQKTVLATDQLAPSHFFERRATTVAETTLAPESAAVEVAAPLALATASGPLPTPAPIAPVTRPISIPEAIPTLEPEDLLATPDVEPTLEPPPAAHQQLRDIRAVKSPVPDRAFSYLSLAVGLIGLALVVVLAYLVWHLSQASAPSAKTASDSTVQAPANPTDPQTAADYSARGYARQGKGDLDGALADYDQAITLDPRNAEALYRRAVARQTKGNWNGALDDYNALLAVTPDNADAYSNRGYVKQTLGDVDGALADYNLALARKPTIAEAFFNVGLIKVRRGDLDGGIAAYNKALELNPKLARAYYNRGNAKDTEGNLDGAIADYTQAIQLDPSNAMACLNRGEARQTKGDTTGALADYSQAITDDPNLAAAFRSRAGLEVIRGDFDAAQTDATRASDLEPKDPSALYNRGLAELGSHSLDDAQADLAKFCQAAPHAAETDNARLYLWVIAAEQNSRDKADDDLANAVQNDWNSSPEDLTSKIADFLVGHIREEELISDASSPDSAREPERFCRVWYFAGVKRVITGDTQTALTYFQRSLATNQKTCCEYLFARTQMVSLGQARQASTHL